MQIRFWRFYPRLPTRLFSITTPKVSKLFASLGCLTYQYSSNIVQHYSITDPHAYFLSFGTTRWSYFTSAGKLYFTSAGKLSTAFCRTSNFQYSGLSLHCSLIWVQFFYNPLILRSNFSNGTCETLYYTEQIIGNFFAMLGSSLTCRHYWVWYYPKELLLAGLLNQQ